MAVSTRVPAFAAAPVDIAQRMSMAQLAVVRSEVGAHWRAHEAAATALPTGAGAKVATVQAEGGTRARWWEEIGPASSAQWHH